MRLSTSITAVTAMSMVMGIALAQGAAHADSPALSSPVSSALPHDCSDLVRIRAFSDDLDKKTLDGVYVGNLSALAVDRAGHISAVSDESYLYSLDVREKAGTLSAEAMSVAPLTDLNGAAPDSEGLAVDLDGTRLISSETEPSVTRYDRDGTAVEALPVPAALAVTPAGRAVSNQTFEGLTLQPGGRTLVASMEGALSGDETGVVRLQTWQRAGVGKPFKTGAQYGYQADQGLGVVELAPAGDGRLLVLERGFTAGVGNTVRLYLADPRRADNVSGTATLTSDGPARLAPKTLLADLADCPTLGATAEQPQPNPLLDNIEGLTVTGHTAAGRLKILLVSDDNERDTQITRLYSLDVALPH
ncbi:esterase-like activity of phytase family protein [Streptomyces sp. GQFP]|uniref:esterase-like activity of phytase family protein n=1 Tax=Streptomyces sp. GQFP TaxID=2907545 RepID=UPI001F3AD102|nr:esterase-like activity of phytase family protein [Streptomyces sp. GQFP]UIX32010.1 esterase-like activity of phytase family protein [Streptomyces sp. GQFP]